MQGVRILVWFSFGNSSACPCAFLQVVQEDGAKGCGFDPRRSATFHTVDPCKKAVFTTNVQQDHTHWHLFCCTKSSERCDVGVSGNLCKTTTPGANESDFCRQVWSRCKPGQALVRVATGLECPCMNASSTSYPLAIHKGRPASSWRKIVDSITRLGL